MGTYPCGIILRRINQKPVYMTRINCNWAKLVLTTATTRINSKMQQKLAPSEKFSQDLQRRKIVVNQKDQYEITTVTQSGISTNTKCGQKYPDNNTRE